MTCPHTSGILQQAVRLACNSLNQVAVLIALQMYNDIAHDPSNPVPGKVFNKPGGPDVYSGVHIDYEGEAVNVQVSAEALAGKAVG